VLRVDALDDLHVARQEPRELPHRPRLERLGQQCVIGVVEDARGDAPRRLPRDAVLVDQEPHELRHGNRGMRIVELDRDVIGQRFHGKLLRPMTAQQVLQRRGGEEELLPQPQVLARGRFVARIQHAGDRLQPHPVGERADVIATVEIEQRQGVGGACGPQPQRVDVTPAPAGDRGVESDRVDGFGRFPTAAPVAVDDRAAESDGARDLRPLEFPRIAIGQPLFRHFLLPPVAHDLAEDAVVVTDPIAVRRNRQRCHAFHEARRKPPEAAVAECRIGLQAADALEVHAELVERRDGSRGEPQIGQRVEEHAADEELEREVIDALAAVAIRAARGLAPAIDDVIARGERDGEEPVVVACVRGLFRDVVAQLRQHRGAKRLDLPRLGRVVDRIEPLGGSGRVHACA